MEPIDTKEIVNDIKADMAERATVVQELKIKYPIEPFLTYSEFTLQDRLEMLPMKTIEYVEHLNRERASYDSLLEQQEMIIGKLYNRYKFEFDKRLTGSEIEKYYIPNDPAKIKFDKAIKRQKYVVEYLEGCVKAIDRMSWVVKDFIKTLSMNI